jgi:hypothetical protein
MRYIQYYRSFRQHYKCLDIKIFNHHFFSLLYHCTLLKNFKHFRTNLGWRLNYSHTSLFEMLDFVWAIPFHLTQFLQHNKRTTLD